MTMSWRKILAPSCYLAALGMMGLNGCVVRDHDHQDVVDPHGYHHEGYYDDHHDWHGGYYDGGHQYHDDPHDWHQ